MYRYIIILTQFYISNSNITMIFGSVPTKFRFGSCGSFSFTGSMTPRFVPVRVCRFVSVRGHTAYIIFHWIGLRENLQETIVSTIKYGAFL